ncbi:MAG: hypothetical protein LBE48_04370 [Methanomassiliicoccaceae archaeon]|jgi:uncharacterized membrane protein|nr:hypothetical protein [Methanomassiliicoccaceae archaeon]
MSDKKNKDKGGVKGAAAYFLKTLIALVILPLAVYYAIPSIFDAVAGGAAGDIAEQVEKLKPYIDRIVIFAIPLLIISIPLGYYPRGDKRKAVCRIAYGAAGAVFLWFVTNGGRFDLAMNDVGLGNVSASSFTIGLNNTTLILIAIVLCLIKGLLGILEYRCYRDELNRSKAAPSE